MFLLVESPIFYRNVTFNYPFINKKRYIEYIKFNKVEPIYNEL